MSKATKLFQALLLVALVVGGVLVYKHQNELLDAYYLRNYTPPTQVATLADQASLTDYGRRLLYRNHPQVDATRAALAKHCQINSGKTLEFGCYISTGNIYIYTINNTALKSEMVTATAHETLHAAYDRLSSKEKKRLDVELEKVAATITDPEFKERMAEYDRLEPGERENELHSILPTEQRTLTPALEAYYRQYFTNRTQIVAAHEAFSTTFDGLRTEIAQLDTQIKAQKQAMQTYLERDNITAYNSLVPTVNAKIRTYNQKVDLYNQYASDLIGTESAAGTQ